MGGWNEEDLAMCPPEKLDEIVRMINEEAANLSKD